VHVVGSFCRALDWAVFETGWRGYTGKCEFRTRGWARLEVMVLGVVLLRIVEGAVSVSESESESESSESEELEELLGLESEELLEEKDEEEGDDDDDTARFLVLCFATIAFSSEKK
jgi:hypothetical protein